MEIKRVNTVEEHNRPGVLLEEGTSFLEYLGFFIAASQGGAAKSLSPGPLRRRHQAAGDHHRHFHLFVFNYSALLNLNYSRQYIVLPPYFLTAPFSLFLSW